jgi:hypothetical protein
MMSDFAQGQRVRLTKDCQDLAHGDQVFKTGEAGTLGRRYRIQDGIQVWEMILDKKEHIGAFPNAINVRICIGHKDIEKI